MSLFTRIKNFLKSAPSRIDLSENQINMFHRLGKDQFNLEDLIEVRQERLTKAVKKGGQTVKQHSYQLAWEFRNIGTIRVKQFKNNAAWQALLKQLEENKLVTFFHNKSETFVRHDLFGTGSERPMTRYLEDGTKTEINSLDELTAWLQTCTYERDIHQFGKDDHWLLPSEFEATKLGDCEDHALWAWQKLKKLGIQAEFVTGTYLTHRNEFGGHAWIMLRKDDQIYVYETVNKSGSMLIPWEKAKKKYFPGLSINHNLQTFHYREMSEDGSEKE
ncbi:MAG: transglutaminase domain-containing protein [Chloroflexota bacterium]